MIVYGVAADVSIAKLFIAGVLPGLVLAAMFRGYIIVWALRNPTQVPAAESSHEPGGQAACVAPPASRWCCSSAPVLGSIYSGLATATEAAALGVAGSLVLAAVEGSLSWKTFVDGLVAACRVYCMIGLILAGAAFLTLAMGFIGLPRHLAEFIGGLDLSPFALVLVLMVFFIDPGLLPRRHLDGGADHRRAAAHGAGGRLRPHLVRHLRRCWWWKWRRSRRRWASTCSCCRG